MAFHHAFAILGASFLVLAGCRVSVLDDACDGARPAITDCTSGALWAECGGSAAEPVFACRRVDGRCYWFEGGCAAVGFEASSCPADDLCCVGASPGYAFDASWRNADVPSSNVYSALYGWGSTPWDRARDRNVAVVLAPLAPVTPSLACSGAELGVPCGHSGSDVSVVRTLPGALVATVSSTGGTLGGWTLSIEVIRDDDATLHARACRVPFTDYVTFQCGPSGPDCATTGTLELAAFPADEATAATTRMHLMATFADGATIDAQL